MAATRSRAVLPSGYTTGTVLPTRQCRSAATVDDTANDPALTAPSEPALTPRLSIAPMRPGSAAVMVCDWPTRYGRYLGRGYSPAAGRPLGTRPHSPPGH
jgi:hypothetical protein